MYQLILQTHMLYSILRWRMSGNPPCLGPHPCMQPSSSPSSLVP
jgi:hypothetical protein